MRQKIYAFGILVGVNVENFYDNELVCIFLGIKENEDYT